MSAGPVPSPGCFITFEGGEGSGKTTAMRRFAAALADAGTDVLTTREPGSPTFLGPVLREVLLSPDRPPVQPWTEALLFAAERAQHVEDVIRPALAAGQIVLCDRYVDSSVAYQGAGRGLGVARVQRLSAWATGRLMPGWTVLLDVPVPVGLSRRARVGDADRLDQEALEFHERVREAFLQRAGREPNRFSVIDATMDPDSVADAVMSAWQARG